MDFSTLLTNIDEHKYVTVREFMSDADLIWQNALKYNPGGDPTGEKPQTLCPEGLCVFKQTTYKDQACRMGSSIL